MRAEEELTGLLTTMTDPNWRPVGEEEAATWNHLEIPGPRGQGVKVTLETHHRFRLNSVISYDVC